MNNNIISFIKNNTGLNDSDILNVYTYGSKVYGTANANSDTDYIVVIDKEEIKESIKTELIDITFYTKEMFLKEIEKHEISILECLWIPEKLKIKESIDFSQYFNLNLEILRDSLSRKSSNSYVKCKKKLTVEKNEETIGIKSLYHSLRILDFGIDIAKNNKITDYTKTNNIWVDISNLSNDKKYNWNYLKEVYQPIYNNKKSEFRLASPKLKL